MSEGWPPATVIKVTEQPKACDIIPTEEALYTRNIFGVTRLVQPVLLYNQLKSKTLEAVPPKQLNS